MAAGSLKLLALDTSTEVMSVAVMRTDAGAARIWQHTAPGGAKASIGLIAGVLDLMQQSGMALRELDAICFGSGPGSFTGLRTACSVAQGLGFGAGVPLLPVNALLTIAEEARSRAEAEGLPLQTGQIIFALLDARMDEVYAAPYQWCGHGWKALGSSLLLRPEALPTEIVAEAGPTADSASVPVWLAGNVFGPYAQRLPAGWQQARQIEALPTATAMLRLAPQLLAEGLAVPAEQALPAYIRDKVAQTTAERTAIKAAQEARPS